MGHKEEQRRELRRRVFYRDGWQDDHGDWFAMCGYGCGTVLSWLTAGIHKRDSGDRYIFDNVFITCKTGCSFEKVERNRRRAREKAERKAAQAVAS